MNSLSPKAAAAKRYDFKKLCHLIGFSKEQMEKVLRNIDNNYQSWSEEKKDKKTGQLKTYQDGTVKKRTFNNPSVFLKTIQKRINRNMLSTIPLPDNIHGGVRGRSNITNAKAHQGNKYLFGTDLRDFYPNINANQVYTTLKGKGYSPNMAHWLSRLTTKDNAVPQGAPTSTTISNLVFLPTDIKLAAFCKKHNITYTRYIDDLTFSSPQNFAPLIGEILVMISGSNFMLNHRKTDYSRYQLITGIQIFLYKIDGSDKIIEKAKAELLNDKPIKPVNNYLNNIRKTNVRKGVERNRKK